MTERFEGSNPSPGTNILYMLTNQEIEKLKKLYGDIIFYREFRNNDGRNILLASVNHTRKMRQTAAWRIEAMLERKLVPPETVDHIDENKLNDSPENLQVLSRSENALKSYLNGRYDLGIAKLKEYVLSPQNVIDHMGDKNGMSKISNYLVLIIRKLYAEEKISKSKIMQLTGLSRRSVETLLSGQSYACVGGPLIVVQHSKGKITPTTIRPWDNDIEVIIDRLKNGETVSELAKELSIARSTLRDRIKIYHHIRSLKN